jgi:hypothetical protein
VFFYTRGSLEHTESHKSLTWAERLKRGFKIDVSVCHHCGGQVMITACIEDPEIIEKILTHLDAACPLPTEIPDTAAGIAIYQQVITKLINSEKRDRFSFYF